MPNGIPEEYLVYYEKLKQTAFEKWIERLDANGIGKTVGATESLIDYLDEIIKDLEQLKMEHVGLLENTEEILIEIRGQ